MSNPIKRVFLGENSSEENNIVPEEQKESIPAEDIEFTATAPSAVTIQSIEQRLKLRSVTNSVPEAEDTSEIAPASFRMSSPATFATEQPQARATVAPDPATYYQVLKNMSQLEDAINSINQIDSVLEDSTDRLTTIENALKDPTNPSAGIASAVSKIRSDLEGVMNNLKMVTKNVTVNTAPNTYNKTVTFEIKQAGSIGLGSLHHMASFDHVFVQTVSAAGTSGYSFKTYQMATKDGKSMWFRQATSDTTWSAWDTNTAESNDIIFSESQPPASAQTEGQIWIAPL